MGDGGKGSRARPFSVTQDEYNSSYETIFGNKPKKWRFVGGCGCYKCQEMVIDPTTFMPATMSRMIVCSTCGNKRCPHSTDHTLECTNSNEVGQEGSRYGRSFE